MANELHFSWPSLSPPHLGSDDQLGLSILANLMKAPEQAYQDRVGTAQMRAVARSMGVPEEQLNTIMPGEDNPQPIGGTGIVGRIASGASKTGAVLSGILGAPVKPPRFGPTEIKDLEEGAARESLISTIPKDDPDYVKKAAKIRLGKYDEVFPGSPKNLIELAGAEADRRGYGQNDPRRYDFIKQQMIEMTGAQTGARVDVTQRTKQQEAHDRALEWNRTHTDPNEQVPVPPAPDQGPGSGTGGTTEPGGGMGGRGHFGRMSLPDDPVQPGRVSAYDPRYTAAEQKWNVPIGLVRSVHEHESSFDPSAQSAHSFGLGQFIPETAAQYGVDRGDAGSNIEGTAHMLSDLYKKTGSWADAVRAYNGGGDPNYPVQAILQRAAQYRSVLAGKDQQQTPVLQKVDESDLPIYKGAKGFVFHHSGGTSLNQLVATLRDRGLGSQYLMDRDGTIYAYGGAGSSHIQPNDKWGGDAPGLSNKNAIGMEVVARDDGDITPAQIASARRFIANNYPDVPVYGHGEVNPGHKQANEGATITAAIRGDRAGGRQPPVQVARQPEGMVGQPPPGPQYAEAETGVVTDAAGRPIATAVPQAAPGGGTALQPTKKEIDTGAGKITYTDPELAKRDPEIMTKGRIMFGTSDLTNEQLQQAEDAVRQEKITGRPLTSIDLAIYATGNKPGTELTRDQADDVVRYLQKYKNDPGLNGQLARAKIAEIWLKRLTEPVRQIDPKTADYVIDPRTGQPKNKVNPYGTPMRAIDALATDPVAASIPIFSAGYVEWKRRTGDEAASLLEQAQAGLTNLAKALGETGRVPVQEQQRLKGLIPIPGEDTVASAAVKVKQATELVQNIQRELISQGGNEKGPRTPEDQRQQNIQRHGVDVPEGWEIMEPQ